MKKPRPGHMRKPSTAKSSSTASISVVASVDLEEAVGGGEDEVVQKRLLEANLTFSVLSVLLSTPDARDQVLVI